MWSPNIAELSNDYRVHAVDATGQPCRSTPDPDEPIQDAADYAAWLGPTLDGFGGVPRAVTSRRHVMQVVCKNGSQRFAATMP
jgi:hypothetical protein